MENFIIGPMTPWGPFVTGFVGLICAFVLYGLIMKYPAVKGDVVKIGDQIHLGAKVFMITEYKILTPVVIALVVACGLSPLGWYSNGYSGWSLIISYCWFYWNVLGNSS